MTEWPIVQHWKCCVPQGTAGSNPALSAINFECELYQASRIKTFALPENVASAMSSNAGACNASELDEALACPST